MKKERKKERKEWMIQDSCHYRNWAIYNKYSSIVKLKNSLLFNYYLHNLLQTVCVSPHLQKKKLYCEILYIYIYKVKVKVPRNRPEGPEGCRGIALLFPDLGTLEGGGWSAPRPGRFTPRIYIYIGYIITNIKNVVYHILAGFKIHSKNSLRMAR
jgi:hypothetical protein